MKQPHKHAAIIKAWADGAEIQGKLFGYTWIDTASPPWSDSNVEFRIKPQPKPDIEQYVSVILMEGKAFLTEHKYEPDNLILLFDGETGALKAAEVIA